MGKNDAIKCRQCSAALSVLIPTTVPRQEITFCNFAVRSDFIPVPARLCVKLLSASLFL